MSINEMSRSSRALTSGGAWRHAERGAPSISPESRIPRRTEAHALRRGVAAASTRGLHCGPTAVEGRLCGERRWTGAPEPSGSRRERVWMSDSSNSGKFARDASKPGTPATPRDEWQATRAEPASPEEFEEWQATRIQTRQPSGIDEWRVPVPSIPTPGRPRSSNESPDAWAATRAQTALATQLLEDEGDYLATEPEEVGRQIGGNERELFVSCAPAEALQQQFDHLQPNFIAVHDIATSSSRKLLTGIAAASGRAVQKLVIRRQGYGTALATLEFVELPTADNQLLRLYTTEADADTASRHAIARILLAYSRLARRHGRRVARARDRLGAEAAARRHRCRPLAEPQRPAPAAGIGKHARHPRPRSRSRHRRRRANDAAGGATRRRVGLHHRNLEPSARAGADRRPGRARARRVQARGLSTEAPAAGDRAALGRHPADGRRSPAGRADHAADAGDSDAVVFADHALDIDRALRQAAERAERRHQLLRVRSPERPRDRPRRRQSRARSSSRPTAAR